MTDAWVPLDLAGAPPAGPPHPAWAAPPELVARFGALPPAVWRNGTGGLTFRLDDDAGDGAGDVAGHGAGGGRYLKWSPPGAPDLVGEARRLRWAGAWTAVPRVLDAGAVGDGATWMLTAALPGRSAVDPRWLADPERAAAGLGAGLRRLHDALPVAACPFTWDVAQRRDRARARIAAGDAVDAWAPQHAALGVDGVLARLARPPDVPPADLVVCHADACAPNTLLAEDGTPTGHVDLGRTGTADRWADLAVMTWSTVWNYGPGLEATVLAAYGVAPDPARTAFYRLLWDVS